MYTRILGVQYRQKKTRTLTHMCIHACATNNEMSEYMNSGKKTVTAKRERIETTFWYLRYGISLYILCSMAWPSTPWARCLSV